MIPATVAVVIEPVPTNAVLKWELRIGGAGPLALVSAFEALAWARVRLAEAGAGPGEQARVVRVLSRDLTPRGRRRAETTAYLAASPGDAGRAAVHP